MPHVNEHEAVLPAAITHLTRQRFKAVCAHLQARVCLNLHVAKPFKLQNPLSDLNEVKGQAFAKEP